MRVTRPLVETGELFLSDTAPVFMRPVHLAYLSDRADKRFKRALEGLRIVASEKET